MIAVKLDPALARFVAAMPTQPDTSGVPDDEYAEVRAATHRYFALNPSPPDPDVEQADHEVTVGGMPARVYRPAADSGLLPALLWIHGGGFTVGMLDADDWRCRMYAKDARCVVVSAEYRLAPEHPYPSGVDDCWAALRWMFAHADTLGIDASRVAIGGASAGGCLAAALTQRARHDPSMSLAFQMLVYPVLDDRLETPSSRSAVDVPIWTRRAAGASWRRYLGPHEGPVTSDAAPARALELTGLPAAYILTAEHDPLRDEGNDYALRLQAAGVPTELHQFPGAFHGFEAIGINAPIVRRALAEQVRALTDALHEPAL